MRACKHYGCQIMPDKAAFAQPFFVILYIHAEPALLMTRAAHPRQPVEAKELWSGCVHYFGNTVSPQAGNASRERDTRRFMSRKGACVVDDQAGYLGRASFANRCSLFRSRSDNWVQQIVITVAIHIPPLTTRSHLKYQPGRVRVKPFVPSSVCDDRQDLAAGLGGPWSAGETLSGDLGDYCLLPFDPTSVELPASLHLDWLFESMDNLKQTLIERLQFYRQKVNEAEENVRQWEAELERWSHAANTAASMCAVEGFQDPATAERSSPDDGLTGLQKIGFREAILRVLEDFPQGARASDIAESLENSDFPIPNAMTSLSARIANNCGRLLLQKRVVRPAKGLFLLAKYENGPDA